MKHRSSAFSLVELSIVLVILGLLVGGVLSGRSLIRAAEIRNITLEHQNIAAAFYQFRMKYHAFPGDFNKATEFWGNAETGTFGGDCTTPATATGSGKQTCNGNGDGHMQGSVGRLNERFRLWQHLANAGVLEGQFSGVAGPSTTVHDIPGVNSPLSKLSGAGWAFYNSSTNSSAMPPSDTEGWWRAGERYNNLFFGGAGDQQAKARILTPEEMWSIDSKLDDGKPGTGIMHSLQWSGCTTAGSRDDYETATYNLADSSARCSIAFPNAL